MECVRLCVRVRVCVCVNLIKLHAELKKKCSHYMCLTFMDKLVLLGAVYLLTAFFTRPQWLPGCCFWLLNWLRSVDALPDIVPWRELALLTRLCCCASVGRASLATSTRPGRDGDSAIPWLRPLALPASSAILTQTHAFRPIT